MRSHTYDFQPSDLVRLIAPTLVPLAVFTALVHLGAIFRFLPNPRPTLDVDRTLLIHKAEATRVRQDAEILLIGDSSCLIDVAARQLADELKTPVLNLGTLSYLGLESHAALLREYFAANTGRVRTVVLLMHPEALRLSAPGEYHTQFLNHFLRGEDFAVRSRPRDYVSHWLGFDLFRSRLLARTMPMPLGGAYGRRYGFSSDLEDYLVAQRGSLVDPEPRKFQGNPEYRLAAQFEKASRTFRAAIPSDIKLLVGITPAPATYVLPDYSSVREQIFAQWQPWLAPAAILTNLPAALPDSLFTKTTHLSEAGARQYTAALADLLR